MPFGLVIVKKSVCGCTLTTACQIIGVVTMFIAGIFGVIFFMFHVMRPEVWFLLDKNDNGTTFIIVPDEVTVGPLPKNKPVELTYSERDNIISAMEQCKWAYLVLGMFLEISGAIELYATLHKKIVYLWIYIYEIIVGTLVLNIEDAYLLTKLLRGGAPGTYLLWPIVLSMVFGTFGMIYAIILVYSYIEELRKEIAAQAPTPPESAASAPGRLTGVITGRAGRSSIL